MEYEKLKEKVKKLGFRVTKDVKGKRTKLSKKELMAKLPKRPRLSHPLKIKPRVPRSLSKCVKWSSRRLVQMHQEYNVLPSQCVCHQDVRPYHLHLHLRLSTQELLSWQTLKLT